MLPSDLGFHCPRYGLGLPFTGMSRLPRADITTTASLPNPPPALARCHDPAFVLGVWQRLQDDIRTPVRVFAHPHGRTLVVLGMFILRQGRGRMTWTPYEWEFPEGLDPVLKRRPAAGVAAQGIPWHRAWLNTLATPLARELTDGWLISPPGASQLARDYVAWLLGRLAKRIRVTLRECQTARKIAAAMALDPAALDAAGRFLRQGDRAGRVCLADYNAACRQAHALRKLRTEAASLVGVYGVLSQAGRFPHRGEPLERLKHLLHGEGLGPRVWRVVLKLPVRTWLVMRDFYDCVAASTVIDYIRCLDFLGCATPPPAWQVRAVLSAYGGPGLRHRSYSDPLEIDRPAWRHLMRVAPREATQENCTAFHLVATWISTTHAQGFTRRQRQGGWPFLVGRANRWKEERELMEGLAGLSWPVPFKRLEIGGVTFQAIYTARDLVEEGLVMRHCAGDDVGLYKKGRYWLYSVRQGDRRRATLEVAPSAAGWQITQLRGKANTECTAFLWHCARQLVELFAPPRQQFRPLPDIAASAEAAFAAWPAASTRAAVRVPAASRQRSATGAQLTPSSGSPLPCEPACGRCGSSPP